MIRTSEDNNNINIHPHTVGVCNDIIRNRHNADMILKQDDDPDESIASNNLF